ncbi:MAG: InlB B-repeat-containing protein, partial [Paludibacteraceae bacterium]|nr:InlB B-repeat-containing protein [Paludibacteraceae bacterium]
MKANNSKYTMFAKRVATMVVAMFMGVSAWGKDYTLVTNVSSLSTNDKVVILATNDANALAGANGVTGYNNNKDATVATSGWKEYKVAKTNSTFTLEDVAAEQFIASPGGNEFKYGDTGGACSVDANGRLICNTRYLASNSGAYRFYGTSQSYPAFYVWKVGASDPQTVNFNAHGGICGTTSLTEESGDAGVELPSAAPTTACASEGWAFYGWALADVKSNTTAAPTIVGKAGEMYYPTSTTELHAVYMQATGQTSTATFAKPTNNEIPTGLTQLSDDTHRPLRVKHNASAIELYIKDYGIFQQTWDIDNSVNNGDGWGYIQSPSNITSISISYSNATKLDHIDQDAGSAELSANKETIECTGDVKKVFFYTPSNGETTISSFTVTYYAVNYYSSPSCCDKIVELSKGTETNATISSFSPESVPTCGNDASREVTIVAAANTGYKFDNGATLGYSGVGSATLVSATDGTVPYTWVYRLSANATGDGSFSVTSATSKSYAITLNGNGATTAGTASVNATYNSATLSAAITNPEKTDYIFDGWYSEEGGSGSLIIDKAGALQANVANYTGAEGIWTRDEATTLYAKWSEHSYINYRTNCCTEYEVALANSGVATGGTFEASKTSVCEGKEVTLTATPGTGYEFDAWTV